MERNGNKAVPKDERELVEMTIAAENAKHDENAEDKRYRARRAIAAATDVLSGIGNMIFANRGAKPVQVTSTLSKKYNDEYKKLLDERKERHARHRAMRYGAISDEFKAARAAAAAKTAHDYDMEKKKQEYEYNIKIKEKESELRKLEDKAKSDNNISVQKEIYKLKGEIEKMKQDRIDARSRADRKSREAIADANNRNKIYPHGSSEVVGDDAWLVGEEREEDNTMPGIH